MKVLELIERLSKLDPNLEVFVPGYEGGYSEVTSEFIVESFKKDINAEWYYGSHEKDDNGDVKGIVLDR
jgi:hypothetical protein